jgi:hypothetical protein
MLTKDAEKRMEVWALERAIKESTYIVFALGTYEQPPC